MSESREGRITRTGGRNAVILRQRFRLFILVALALGIVGASSPARAHGEYTVAQCVPSSVPYVDAGAYAFGPFSIWAGNECGGDHGLRLDTGSNTGWTANGAGLSWRFTAPPGTLLITANAAVHYGNDGGFAAASFSDGAPQFSVFGTCQTPTTCWTSAG